MKSKEPDRFGPYDWPQSGRPVQPYRLDPVAIAIDDEDTEDQVLVDPTTQPYLIGPIHTEVLKLKPELGMRFVHFATTYGLHGFERWVEPPGDGRWEKPGSFKKLISLMDRYQMGIRRFTLEELHAAWVSLPAGAVRLQSNMLHDAFGYAALHGDDPEQAARWVIERGWEADVFQIELALDLDHNPAIIYERPHNIWSRAWFELIEGLRGERLPKTCADCGYHFVPRRTNGRFCSDTCSKRTYEKKRSKDPKRRASRAASRQKRENDRQAEAKTDPKEH